MAYVGAISIVHREESYTFGVQLPGNPTQDIPGVVIKEREREPFPIHSSCLFLFPMDICFSSQPLVKSNCAFLSACVQPHTVTSTESPTILNGTAS